MKTLEELRRDVAIFRDERNWKQFHTPRNLAMSISIEAAELLEIFQWSKDDLEVEPLRKRIEEELADVLIYCVLMADAMDMDLDEIITKKILINNEKYPVKKAYGKSVKYTELD